MNILKCFYIPNICRSCFILPARSYAGVRNMVLKTIITSPNIYPPIGPYSHAILADKTLYVSGILGMDLKANFAPCGVEGQTKQALENLKHVLEAGGASLESVIKITVLLARLEDFKVVNEIYVNWFPESIRPARTTFQVGKLPHNAALEIEAIALSGCVIVKNGGCP